MFYTDTSWNKDLHVQADHIQTKSRKMWHTRWEHWTPAQTNSTPDRPYTNQLHRAHTYCYISPQKTASPVERLTNHLIKNEHQANNGLFSHALSIVHGGGQHSTEYCITPIYRVEEFFAIIANWNFARNFPPAKIISTANGISRNFPPAKFTSREIFLPAKIKL